MQKSQIVRYIHGSEDSTDVDVIYVFDTLPSKLECKGFCDGKGENGNIIVIKNGVVVSAYKGSVDEVNNSLFDTYKLHKQTFPLLIEKRVERDIILKDIKVLRKILSALTRTKYRTEIKEALRGDWQAKASMLKDIDYKSIDFSAIPKANKDDLLKSFAFQIGQAIGLHEGVELYTKRSIAEHFPTLAPYIKRQEADIDGIIEFIIRFATILEKLPVKSADNDHIWLGEPYNSCYNINKEIKVE